MLWSQEAQKLDDEVYKIVVQDKNLDALFQLFPDAKSFTEFSNIDYNYPHRRNSLLALLVQTNDSELFCRTWNHYFANYSDEEAPKMKKYISSFISGTNSVGQKIDYHYFADDAPPKIKAEIEMFLASDDEEREAIEFKIKHDLLPKDIRTPKQIANWDIYCMIEWASYVVGDCSETSSDNKVIMDGNRLITEMTNPDTSMLWKKEYMPCSKLVLMKNLKLKKNNFLLSVIENLNPNKKESFAKQALKQMSFPCSFLWSGAALNKWEKMVKASIADGNSQDLINFFEINQGMLIIENEEIETNKKTSNSLSGVNNLAYSVVPEKPSVPIIGFYSDKMLSSTPDSLMNAFRHELTHALNDTKIDGFEEKGFSNMEIMKLVFMSTYFNSKEKYSEGTKIIKSVLLSYNDYAYCEETMARVMEDRDLSKDPLLLKTKDLIKIYNKAKLKNKAGVIKHIETMVNRICPQRDELAKLVEQFDNSLINKLSLENESVRNSLGNIGGVKNLEELLCNVIEKELVALGVLYSDKKNDKNCPNASVSIVNQKENCR